MGEHTVFKLLGDSMCVLKNARVFDKFVDR